MKSTCAGNTVQQEKALDDVYRRMLQMVIMALGVAWTDHKNRPHELEYTVIVSLKSNLHVLKYRLYM